jgi:hypothetical protein
MTRNKVIAGALRKIAAYYYTSEDLMQGYGHDEDVRKAYEEVKDYGEAANGQKWYQNPWFFGGQSEMQKVRRARNYAEKRQKLDAAIKAAKARGAGAAPATAQSREQAPVRGSSFGLGLSGVAGMVANRMAGK